MVASCFGLLRIQKRTKWKFLTPPLESSSCWLGDGQKNYILPTLVKVMGVQSSKCRYYKWCKSPLFGGRFGGRLMFWPAMQAKKVEIQIFLGPSSSQRSHGSGGIFLGGISTFFACVAGQNMSLPPNLPRNRGLLRRFLVR